MIDVQIVQRKGETTLIKYLEDGVSLKQVVIPTRCITDDNTVHTDDLDMAIIYGLPWEEIARPTVTSQMIANKLRQYNIWTLEDLERDLNAAVGALMSVYGIDAATLLRDARRYVKRR